MKTDQHVVQRARGWAVLGEGNQRDTVVLPTQEAAIAQARKIARRSGGELIVHNLNGRSDSLKDSESTLRSKP